MVRYSKLLGEIHKRYGSKLTAPGDETLPAVEPSSPAPAPPPSEEAGDPDVMVAEALRGRARTEEINSDLLARLFTEPEAPPAGKAPAGREVQAENGAEALPLAPPAVPVESPRESPPCAPSTPFRNHAELLKFASGLIADIEGSVRKKMKKKKKE